MVFIEDSRLCFALCLGPNYFDKISGFVYNILADMYNIQAVTNLEYFIVIGATLEEATWAQKVVIKVLRYLGFYISWGKVTPPSQVCRYLGLDIDSIRMEIRLHSINLSSTLRKRQSNSSVYILHCLKPIFHQNPIPLKQGRILGFVLGPRDLSDTNLLVSVMQKSHVWGYAQSEAPTQGGSCSGGK